MHSNKCYNPKCTFCPIINKQDSLKCSVTRNSIPMRHNMSCKSSNLTYCITCQTCFKQYVGQTRNSIAKRFYSHFFNVRHQKQTYAVGLHFSRTDHKGIKDIKINVVEFIKLPPHTDIGLVIRRKGKNIGSID